MVKAPHVQYERLGSDVMLPCGTASWDAAVTWRVNGTDLAPDLLNGSQLVLRSLELAHSGLYACFHRDSWHLRHQVLLHANGQASCVLGAPAQAGWLDERKNMRFGGLDMEKQAN
ncbi:hypothetical protein A6R68_03871 [Neotoma lepida]|uniref:Ig-like domain-containing protein n=1 Tax=Neotoma lepida TaxID=56216 RepID=A0A1A6GMT8_NEOLE|nr:hypothetical protein A6R68_03871 [Neotoma lepida]